jgi:hypothetical protein
MYCPSCGVNVTPGSSYCNYCGEKLSGANSDSIIKSPEVKPGALVGAMVFTFVFGLVAITVLMGMMKAVLRLDVGVVLGFASLSFLILLLLEAVFIRLLLRRKRAAEDAGHSVPLKGETTRELDAAHARALPEPMASVTEHTTRAFDPISRERTSK